MIVIELIQWWSDENPLDYEYEIFINVNGRTILTTCYHMILVETKFTKRS